jgi:hypothetical protein
MDSTVTSRATEANDVLAARADERLAHAYEQIRHADEQLARLTEQMTRMEQEAARPASAVLLKPSRGRPLLRGFIGVMAAACIIGGALALQSSYGATAGPAIARWAAPYLGSVSWSPLAKPEQITQPMPSGVRLAAADAAPPPAMPLAQAGTQDVASPHSMPSADVAQVLQTMARDLTTVQQGIEELKASQARLASDNAGIAEQFKASQEQLMRLVARLSEQEQRAARAAVPPPPPPSRPIAEAARRPAPAAPQARAQPLQLQPAQREGRRVD